MALFAISSHREGILGIVAGAAGLTFFHLAHGGVLGSCLVGEQLGVAIDAFVHAQVEVMTECGITGFGFEGDGTGGEAFVAFVAVPV